MPIGIQRLNAKHQLPNPNIIFIKPLPGPTAAFAQDFLERVAAICRPILSAHHISIMSLEEYEPNPEFIGRNFNAGEIIQLVLKAPYSGHWLSFRSVVMVMMHELAHCKQMNHSGAFWKIRNAYAEEMRGLWVKGYTGDGFWSRGRTALSGQYEPVRSLEPEWLPEQLCGGTFRTRGKRKRNGGDGKGKPELSYAERQQRRIARKFGKNGVALGDDEDVKVKLENGKRPVGKPRVAKSKRGRELRAAAALARFGQQVKEEEDAVKEEAVKKEDSETESEDEYEDADVKYEEALEANGKKILDGKGRGMVKVCEDESADDIHVKEEMQELQNLDNIPAANTAAPRGIKQEPSDPVILTPEPTKSSLPKSRNGIHPPTKRKHASSPSPSAQESNNPPPAKSQKTATPPSISPPPPLPSPRKAPKLRLSTCPICSLANPAASLLCAACSHVLDPSLDPQAWKCSSAACAGNTYVNAGDCGICGVCGSRKEMA